MEPEGLGRWVELRRWGVASAEVRAGHWADCRPAQEDPEASMEEGKGHRLVQGSPEETKRRKRWLW